MTPIGSPVIAQMGLVARLRTSLSQMSVRIEGLIGAGMPALSSAAEIAWRRSEIVPSGSPRANLFFVPGELRMTPGSMTSFAELIMQPTTRSSPIERARRSPGSRIDRSGRAVPVASAR
jgi:hypothetical protein